MEYGVPKQMQMDGQGVVDERTSFSRPVENIKHLLFRPVNIDIIITPCESTIEGEYEQGDLVKKLTGGRRRIATSHRKKKTNSWLNSYVDERRLRSAASNKDIDEAIRVLNKNADIDLNAGDDKQRTALHISAANDAEDVVRLLLENGASPHVKDVNGNTPLHLAACSGMIPIVTLLLHYGGDISATDSNGKTPLHLILARQKLFQKPSAKESIKRYDYMKSKAHLQEIADLLKEYLTKEGSYEERDGISMLSEKIPNLSSDAEVSLIPHINSYMHNFRYHAKPLFIDSWYRWHMMNISME